MKNNDIQKQGSILKENSKEGEGNSSREIYVLRKKIEEFGAKSELFSAGNFLFSIIHFALLCALIYFLSWLLGIKLEEGKMMIVSAVVVILTLVFLLGLWIAGFVYSIRKYLAKMNMAKLENNTTQKL